MHLLPAWLWGDQSWGSRTWAMWVPLESLELVFAAKIFPLCLLCMHVLLQMDACIYFSMRFTHAWHDMHMCGGVICMHVINACMEGLRRRSCCFDGVPVCLLQYIHSYIRETRCTYVTLELHEGMEMADCGWGSYWQLQARRLDHPWPSCMPLSFLIYIYASIYMRASQYLHRGNDMLLISKKLKPKMLIWNRWVATCWLPRDCSCNVMHASYDIRLSTSIACLACLGQIAPAGTWQGWHFGAWGVVFFSKYDMQLHGSACMCDMLQVCLHDCPRSVASSLRKWRPKEAKWAGGLIWGKSGTTLHLGCSDAIVRLDACMCHWC